MPHLVFEGSSGSAVCIDRETGKIIASVDSRGGLMANPPAIDLLSKLKRENQTVQEYIREQAGGR